MRITRKFRGKTITSFDSDCRFEKQVDERVLKDYYGNDFSLWIDEYTGEIFEFENNNPCESTFFCKYKDFDELNKNYTELVDDEEEECDD